MLHSGHAPLHGLGGLQGSSQKGLQESCGCLLLEEII